jgi:hypothetical protein
MGIHFFLTFTMYVRPVSVKKNVYVRITDRTVRLHIRSMAQQKKAGAHCQDATRSRHENSEIQFTRRLSNRPLLASLTADAWAASTVPKLNVRVTVARIRRAGLMEAAATLLRVRG